MLVMILTWMQGKLHIESRMLFHGNGPDGFFNPGYGKCLSLALTGPEISYHYHACTHHEVWTDIRS